jgi:hypothetical protein
MLTSSAAIVTVWFVVITGTIFACIRMRTADIKKRIEHNLTVGNGREQENGGRKGTEE